jgi:monoamine oxidase
MQTYDVIIIGAGIAGLAAGYQLKNSGVTDFIILEAQDYVGGRIKTFLEWGQPVELGAEFIHGEHTITAEIARTLNLDYINTHEDIKLIDSAGTALTHDKKQLFFALSEYVIEHGKHGVSVYDVIEKNTLTDDLTIKQLVHMSFADLEGDDSDKLDSGALRDAFNYEKYNGDNILLKDGYQQIVDFFNQDLPISLESPVSTINYGNDDVTVMLASGEELRAKKVIITVSLGVLQNKGITFRPELPADKLTAINKLGMGHTMKLFLRFKEPHNATDLFHYADGANGSLQTISNWWASATNPYVLVGYCGGSRSGEVLGLPEDRLIQKVLEDLSIVLGKNIENDLVDYKISRWDTNLFTLGSYSYHPVDTMMKDREALASPTADTLFWAGEATNADENYATVQGAILSGYRAAAEVIQFR